MHASHTGGVVKACFISTWTELDLADVNYMLLARSFRFPLWYLAQCHGTTPPKLYITYSSYSVSAFLEDGAYF